MPNKEGGHGSTCGGIGDIRGRIGILSAGSGVVWATRVVVMATCGVVFVPHEMVLVTCRVVLVTWWCWMQVEVVLDTHREMLVTDGVRHTWGGSGRGGDGRRLGCIDHSFGGVVHM